LAAATEAGVTTVEQLRAMPAADVTAKFRSAGMIVDGWIIPEDPSITFEAGRQNAVDVLVGSNKDEAFFPGARTAQEFEQQARARWGALADEFLALYPHATDAEALASGAQQSNDGTFWAMRLYADQQAQRGSAAYLYFFAQNPPAPAGQPAFPAAHAAEVPYVFDNVGELPLFPDRSDPTLAAASAPDLEVAERMSAYWANFARSGDPNGAGLPQWQPHRVGASERAIILDADPSSEQLPAKPRLELFDKLYAQMRAR
jgi:para-nitrobenzyl esterase